MNLGWCGVTLVGVAGYWAWRGGLRLVGLTLLALYAVLGFDGLLHYRLAALSEHTLMMNLTILTEVAASALLLGAVLRAARRRPRRSHA